MSIRRCGDLEIPRVNFVEYILESLRQYPGKIATECALTGRKYTFNDLIVKSTNLNRSLRKKLNLQKDDVVALLLPNVPEFPICALGILMAGLKLTTINPVYTPDEIRRQLLDSGAKALITLPEHSSKARNAVQATSTDVIITIKNATTDATPDSLIDFQELIDTKLNIADVELSSPEDTIFMPYSSGTTGLPKGVELSNYNIIANMSQINHPAYVVTQKATEKHQDVTIVVLPLFHIYGFTWAFSMLSSGVKLVTVSKFTPEIYLNALRCHRSHILLLVPPMVILLNTHPEVKTEYLSSLRNVVCGAAPLGALDEEKFRVKVAKPINILQGYGLTETSPAVALVPITLQGQYPGSMGAILPNTFAKIIDPEDKDGKHLGVGQTGELLVKGPQVMKGYHNKPEETTSAFLNGWFRTGDLVRYNEKGMLYIADRIKELIKVKGLQVAPAELEEIIRDYPGVADAAVTGIPHEYHGEVPKAYVIAKKGNGLDVEKLKKHVESKVSKHKRLEGGIAVVQDIPKNASGKILRRQLKLRFENEGI